MPQPGQHDAASGSPPTRRAVLKLGLAGAALLAVGAGGLQAWPGAAVPAPAGLRVLSPRAYAVLVAVADAVCPSDPPWPLARTLGVAEKVDAVLARMQPDDAAQVVAALHLLESALAGLVLDGQTGPFSARSMALRRSTLVGWKCSAIPVKVTAFKALRGLCATAYFADPRTFAAVGYQGPPDFGQANAPARQPVQDRALWDAAAAPSVPQPIEPQVQP